MTSFSFLEYFDAFELDVNLARLASILIKSGWMSVARSRIFPDREGATLKEGGH